MAYKIKWDRIEDRKYKTGVDHGVIYTYEKGAYGKAAAWNGLTTVNKTPSGAEDNEQYADNMLYFNMKTAEKLSLTIECFMYPDEFKPCIGEMEIAKGVIMGQQRRSIFGFAYRNLIGNAVEGADYGYELNLVYGCSASTSEQSNQTTNESPSAATFSFPVSTTPVQVPGIGPDGKPFKPTACLTLVSTDMDPDKLAELEAILYGTEDGEDGRLPLPEEVIAMFAAG